MDDIIIESNSTLNKQFVETILKEYIEDKTGKTVQKITAKIKDNEFMGFSVLYSNQISEQPTINNREKPKKPIKIDTTFKEWVID
jgi:hypothetical protein